MHGGAPGSGAPVGNKNALRTGRHTQEVIGRRKALSNLLRKSRELMRLMK